MKDFVLRWREVGIIAGVLFLINVASRVIAKQMEGGDPATLADRQGMAGLVAIGVVTLVFAGMTIYWGRKRSTWDVGTSLGFAAAIACLLSVFIGPLLVGESPFASGAGDFFKQFWFWAGEALVGITLGFIVLISFTMDYKSKQLKDFAERNKALPKRRV